MQASLEEHIRLGLARHRWRTVWPGILHPRPRHQVRAGFFSLSVLAFQHCSAVTNITHYIREWHLETLRHTGSDPKAPANIAMLAKVRSPPYEAMRSQSVWFIVKTSKMPCCSNAGKSRDLPLYEFHPPRPASWKVQRKHFYKRKTYYRPLGSRIMSNTDVWISVMQPCQTSTYRAHLEKFNSQRQFRFS